MSEALLSLSLSDLSDALAAGQVSSRAITEAALARIEATDGLLNAFLHVDRAGALRAADAADARHKRSIRLSPLDGVPISLKDLFVTEGIETTAASRFLKGWVPPYDGSASRRLKAAGAVMIGKNNLDEFAMGSSNEHSAYGPVRNPWNPERVPGGSSGGSAAAVAARQVFGALGTDTGGSIRQPAAFCGIWGIKPTYGRVSRAGVIAFASSLDQVGPLARSPRDLALMLQAIAGHDPEDSTSQDLPVPDFTGCLDQGIQGLRIGLPSEYFAAGLDPEVESAVRAAIATFEAQGASVAPVSLPHTPYLISCYYVLAPAEASSNLARYDGVRYGQRASEPELLRMYARSRFEGFGPEVRRRILLGSYVLSAGYYDAYYAKAQRARELICRDFDAAFEKVDVLACPTTPTVAYPLSSKLDDPLAMYLDDILTLGVNLAGLPALSAPAGLNAEGMPIGLQLIGKPWKEAELLGLSEVLYQSQGKQCPEPKLAL